MFKKFKGCLTNGKQILLWKAEKSKELDRKRSPTGNFPDKFILFLFNFRAVLGITGTDCRIMMFY